MKSRTFSSVARRRLGTALLSSCLAAAGCSTPAEPTGGVGATGGVGGGAGTGGGGSGALAGTGGSAGTAPGGSGGTAGTLGGAGLGGAAAGTAGGGGVAAGSGGAAGDAGGSGVSGATAGGASGDAGSAGSGAGAGAGGANAGAGGAAGAAGGGSGGAAAGSAGGAGMAGAGGSGGAADCKGNALSLSSNVAGGADPAKSRVMVDFMQSADLPIGASNRTVEFWAYVLTSSWVGENNTMFEYGDQSTQNAGFGLDFGGNNATMDPYTNGSFDNDNQASGLMESPDQWVHFAMTWDGSAVRLYVNGTVRSTRMSAGNMLQTARTELTIGGNPRGSYFNGTIDEFRIWNVARSGAEITAAMGKTLVGNETGLTAYYKFNEMPGATTAADSVTTGGHMAHDGTLMATMTNQRPTFIASTAPVTCP